MSINRSTNTPLVPSGRLEGSVDSANRVEGVRSIAILGATGSIGASTLDLVRSRTDEFKVCGLSAGSRWERLLELAREFSVTRVALACREAAAAARVAIVGTDLSFVEVLEGPEGIDELACMDEVEVVVAAIVGFAGLQSTLAALERGKVVALANKESVVCGASLLRKALKGTRGRTVGTILPVDSEHSALFQCLQGEKPSDVRSLWLSASGGPFREWSLDQMASVTTEQALAHPRWSMGPKISVDSATMMNKGLELIEACQLFGLDESQVEIMVHPQSIVHSMVEFQDGSITAQLSVPDMKGPLAFALGWPQGRLRGGMDRLDLRNIGTLQFEAPDVSRFPSLGLARQVQRMGDMAAIACNAANEVAVAGFLNEQVRFVDIVPTVAEVVNRCCGAMSAGGATVTALDEVIEIDVEARRYASEVIGKLV